MIAIRLAIRLSGNLFIFSFSESLTKFRQTNPFVWNTQVFSTK